MSSALATREAGGLFPPAGVGLRRFGVKFAARTPSIAQYSSFSERSPLMPTAPITAPAPSQISTPPGAVTKRPPEAAASAFWNAGASRRRAPSARLDSPMPSAPQALPIAISGRRMPEPSARLSATRWPPASSTATVSGARPASRPAESARSTIVLAAASGRSVLSSMFSSPRDDPC